MKYRWGRFGIGLIISVLPAAVSLSPLTGRAAAVSSGIEGTAGWRGKPVEGITVYAYRSSAEDFLSGDCSRSKPTGPDGKYRMELAPGKYTLVARGGNGGSPERPAAGDLFCYYNGSPVEVSEGRWSSAGFNMVRHVPEERKAGESTSLAVRVEYRQEPLTDYFLYLYSDPSQGFRGPGLAFYRIGQDGVFKTDIPPGKYFIIARKRAGGRMIGPLKQGDYFSYYPGNPVIIGEGDSLRITMNAERRLKELVIDDFAIPPVTGRVLDNAGNPVPRIRVFAYRPGFTVGKPLFLSDPSGSDGRFRLLISEPGSYTLMARERFGGPAGPGEYTGYYLNGMPVTIDKRGLAKEVVITVRR